MEKLRGGKPIQNRNWFEEAKARSPITIGSTSTTVGPSTPSTPQTIGSSFNRVVGGSPSMGDLEAASMRLADAAARRESEKEISAFEREKETMAAKLGYRSFREMQEDLNKKRLAGEKEMEEDKKYAEWDKAMDRIKKAQEIKKFFASSGMPIEK
jgi:cell fate (sporulation/competence/biofilm development) regulator YlbF (YheA/YmcA/DUF963 family)